ncbi:hypothetical protein JAAARDRAFT_654724 [Jaapia argillacea MUCL 33604]|uniref:Uncharacterized protein n=1 Tax=Jaapia argillacea MUCL 33604 TaxID=933084 RepID=A0A067PZ28_9AGAM|nr:hypothetical protein JAAARDRAFT_654724 [Jaapia argillacea MUCL 33604]
MGSITEMGFNNIRNRPPTSSKSNKHRLYLAFYHQTFEWDPSIRFRTALLVTPKDPASSKGQSWRYHVNETFYGRGLYRWEYEGTQVNLLGSDPARRLVALVHLSKLDPEVVDEVVLAALLRNVRVDPEGGDGGAREWIRNAVRYLVEEEVIPPLPLRAQTIWQNGYEFAQRVEDRDESTVPTCDIFGQRQKSNILRGR